MPNLIKLAHVFIRYHILYWFLIEYVITLFSKEMMYFDPFKKLGKHFYYSLKWFKISKAAVDPGI